MKNLGKITNDQDIVNKGYVDNRLSTLVSRGRVVVSTTNISQVTIPINFQNPDNLFVYHNGLLLEEDIHYSISGNRLTLMNYACEVDDILSFVHIG